MTISRDGSRRRGGRPRQADIAKLAGVSQATVSVVLSGRTDGNITVSPDTRERVLAAIQQLNYVANPAARSLAGGTNRLLGMYTFESVFPTDHNDFYYPFLVGIEHQAEALGYDLVLFTSATGRDGVRSIYRGGVNRLALADGCVLLGKQANREELASLVQEGFPFVTVGRREVPGAALDYVTADYTSATAQVVRHLLTLGHRHITYVGVDAPVEPDTDRETGYRQALAQAGTPVTADLLRVDPGAITPAWLRARLDAGTTALVAEEDTTTDALLAAMAQLGLAAPRDVSLAVLGVTPRPEPAAPAWTNFRIPREGMGRQAVSLLVEVLSEPGPTGPRHVALPCVFEPGATTAPPRTAHP